ncbi:hypothetical protein V8F20_012021 [Naviculisporaceae sp. PSN 640]
MLGEATHIHSHRTLHAPARQPGLYYLQIQKNHTPSFPVNTRFQESHAIPSADKTASDCPYWTIIPLSLLPPPDVLINKSTMKPHVELCIVGETDEGNKVYYSHTPRSPSHSAMDMACRTGAPHGQGRKATLVVKQIAGPSAQENMAPPGTKPAKLDPKVQTFHQGLGISHKPQREVGLGQNGLHTVEGGQTVRVLVRLSPSWAYKEEYWAYT